MGSITFSVQSTTPAINASKAFTVPDAHVARFVQAVQAAYPIINADGTRSTPTTAQALTSWANGLMQGTIGNVQSFEAQQAHNTAVAGVTPITAT